MVGAEMKVNISEQEMERENENLTGKNKYLID